jgi:hypothetical protein
MAQDAHFLPRKPHPRHVTGIASRLREQMQGALPAPSGCTLPRQCGYSFAILRLVLPSLVAFFIRFPNMETEKTE